MIATATFPLHHVFVDYENVHDSLIGHVGQASVHFTLLVGAHQTRLDAALVEQLMNHAQSVQLVRLTSSGKNALDFVLAYHVGRAAVASPSAQFHIVSKDTGFDALVKHLLLQQIKIQRHNDLSTLPFAPKFPKGVRAPIAKPLPKPKAKEVPKATKATSAQEIDWYERVVDYLESKVDHRPSRLKSLTTYIKAFCGKNVTDEGVAQILERLDWEEEIDIDSKGAVTYRAPRILLNVVSPLDTLYVDEDDIPF